MTANDIDAKAPLDRIYFALDAKAFGVFQDTLMAPAPWNAPGASIGKTKQEL